LWSSAKLFGAVTAVAISPDTTFVAVGHQSGNVCLYDLASPSPKPARTSLALSQAALSSGKKEGHLVGTAITHLAFVGRRHTAIITGDESGRAFWWSLGKVVGVESNDVIRLLGAAIPAGVPGGTSSERTIRKESGSRQPKEHALFAAMPLPVGAAEHLADNFGMIALLTASKLMIVGLKPSARTLYRRSRQADGGRSGRSIGCAAWLPVRPIKASGKGLSDPVLAYSWGNQLRFLKIQVTPAEQPPASDMQKGNNYAINRVGFVEGRIWREEEPILRLDWINSTVRTVGIRKKAKLTLLFLQHVLIATSLHIGLLDIGSMRKVEQQSFSWLSELSYITDDRGRECLVSLADRLCAYKGRIFALVS
jgi:WD40 repeat protein